MAKRLRDKKTGKIIHLEFTREELAEILEVDKDDLGSWRELIEPMQDDLNIYRVASVEELDLWKKRALILRTRMSVEAVRKIEEAGLLKAYAELALDCPPGVTAHVWRSYAVVVLMQMKYNQMIDAQELATRANLTEADAKGKHHISSSMAQKHLRLLQALNLLKPTEERWEHQGLPKSWRELA